MINYNTLFFLRKEKTVQSTALTPLYLRITCGGKRVELSINLKVDAKKWNAQKQVLTGKSPETLEINDFLEGVRVKLRKYYTFLYDRGEIVTAELLKAHLQGKIEKQKTILDAFESHLKFNQKKYNPATNKKYGYCKQHLQNFIWKHVHDSDIFLSKIDLHFIREFQCYLAESSDFVNEAGLTVHKKVNEHNSTLKYIKMLQTITNSAIAYKWIDNNPFAGFKEKFKSVDQVYLTDRELRQIMALTTLFSRLDIVKDLFVFCCFTGLAYADLKKLSKEHIIFGMDGEKWIHIKRTKSHTMCKIPLLPQAIQILEKYKHHPWCEVKETLLPVLSNQNLNGYLKEIADLAGVSKNLSTHVARRTFASVALNSGIPPDTIVKVIGHSTFKYLHLYAVSGDAKLSADMKAMGEKFEQHNKSDLPQSRQAL